MTGISETSGRDRRRHVRVRVSVRGSLQVPPRAPLRCEIYNMSIGGALLETAQSVRLGQSVVLHVETFGPIPGHVARVTSTVIAIAFERSDDATLAEFLKRHAQGAETFADPLLAASAG